MEAWNKLQVSGSVRKSKLCCSQRWMWNRENILQTTSKSVKQKGRTATIMISDGIRAYGNSTEKPQTRLRPEDQSTGTIYSLNWSTTRWNIYTEQTVKLMKNRHTIFLPSLALSRHHLSFACSDLYFLITRPRPKAPGRDTDWLTRRPKWRGQ